ncbi:MAG: RICIN domain-containing protein [Labedaea sp.]
MPRTGRLLLSLALAAGLSAGVAAAPAQAATPTPGVYYELFLPQWNRSDFKCVDAFNTSTRPGSALDFFDCHSADIQLWRFELVVPPSPFGPAIYEIVNKKSGLCMTMTAVFFNGSAVRQDTCGIDGTDIWTLHTPGVLPDHFDIVAANSPNDCVGAANLTGADGTALVMREPCRPITDAGFEDPRLSFQLG